MFTLILCVGIEFMICHKSILDHIILGHLINHMIINLVII